MKRIFLSLIPALLLSAHAADDLYTKSYALPQDFFDRIESVDLTPKDSSFRKAFERAGFDFPEGVSVQFHPVSRVIHVRATEDQQQRIQTLLRGMAPSQLPLVSVQIEEITATKEEVAKLEILQRHFEARNFEAIEGFTLLPGVRFLASEASLVNELRRKPEVPEEANPVVSAGIVGVYTETQYEIVRKAIEEAGIPLRVAPPATAASERPILVQEGEARWGIIPTAGSDGFTLRLSLYFPPHGGALFADGDSPEPSLRLDVWDGQTVVWQEKRKDGDIRIIFVTAHLVDAHRGLDE